MAIGRLPRRTSGACSGCHRHWSPRSALHRWWTAFHGSASRQNKRFGLCSKEHLETDTGDSKPPRAQNHTEPNLQETSTATARASLCRPETDFPSSFPFPLPCTFHFGSADREEDLPLPLCSPNKAEIDAKVSDLDPLVSPDATADKRYKDRKGPRQLIAHHRDQMRSEADLHGLASSV